MVAVLTNSLAKSRSGSNSITDNPLLCSEQPLAFAGNDTNLRRYVANAPNVNTDPNGLEARPPVNIPPMPIGPFRTVPFTAGNIEFERVTGGAGNSDEWGQGTDRTDGTATIGKLPNGNPFYRVLVQMQDGNVCMTVARNSFLRRPDLPIGDTDAAAGSVNVWLKGMPKGWHQVTLDLTSAVTFSPDSTWTGGGVSAVSVNYYYFDDSNGTKLKKCANLTLFDVTPGGRNPRPGRPVTRVDRRKVTIPVYVNRTDEKTLVGSFVTSGAAMGEYSGTTQFRMDISISGIVSY